MNTALLTTGAAGTASPAVRSRAGGCRVRHQQVTSLGSAP